MPSVHPTVIIDLAQYDSEGTVVLSEPTMARLEIFDNLVIDKFLSEGEKEVFDELPTHKRDEYLKPFIKKHPKTYQVMQILSYVESAPWKDYDGYMKFGTHRITKALREGIDELNRHNPFVLMDEYHEYEMGMEMFKSGIRDGTANSYIAYYITYAQFLQNHSKEEWMDMTQTDMAMFSIYHSIYDDANNDRLALKVANNVSKAFGGKEE